VALLSLNLAPSPFPPSFDKGTIARLFSAVSFGKHEATTKVDIDYVVDRFVERPA
jgi:hypothetical protein